MSEYLSHTFPVFNFLSPYIPLDSFIDIGVSLLRGHLNLCYILPGAISVVQY